MLKLNFDDPYVAVALLAIIIGLRLAVYVVERMQRDRSAQAGVTLAPDDAAEAPISTPELQTEAHDAADAGFYRVVAEILDAAIIAVLLVFCLVRPFVMQAFFIPSDSMVPTLRTGDKLLATKYTFDFRAPRLGDVVVFRAPPICLELVPPPQDQMQDQVDYVKRVIGVPGDRIRIEDQIGVFVNGHLLHEPYVAATPNYDFPTDSEGNLQLSYANHQGVAQLFMPYIQGKVFVVPPGTLFVMGDNRRESFDSHDWGVLSLKALIGKASFIFWPPDRAGFIH